MAALLQATRAGVAEIRRNIEQIGNMALFVSIDIVYSVYVRIRKCSLFTTLLAFLLKLIVQGGSHAANCRVAFVMGIYGRNTCKTILW